VYTFSSSANTCGELTVIRRLRIMKIRNFNVYVNLAL
jgi:hypothetical protein